MIRKRYYFTCIPLGLLSVHSAAGEEPRFMVHGTVTRWQPIPAFKQPYEKEVVDTWPFTLAVKGSQWALRTDTETSLGIEISHRLFDGANRYVVTERPYLNSAEPMRGLIDTYPFPVQGRGHTITLWFAYCHDVWRTWSEHAVLNPRSMRDPPVQTNLALQVEAYKDGYPADWDLVWKSDGERFVVDHFEVLAWTNFQRRALPLSVVRTNFSNLGAVWRNGEIRTPNEVDRQGPFARFAFSIEVTNVAAVQLSDLDAGKFDKWVLRIADYRFGEPDDQFSYHSRSGFLSRQEVLSTPRLRAQAEMFERAARRATGYGDRGWVALLVIGLGVLIGFFVVIAIMKYRNVGIV